MSRSGSGLYDSDGAMDYFAEIRLKVEQSLESCMHKYRTNLENERSEWLARMLTAIELILLFERREPAFAIFLEAAPLLEWREALFAVWDGDWKEDEDTDTYGQIIYRQQHRPAIVRMFDRLESIARYWSDLAREIEYGDLTPLLPDYPLPFFSIYRGKYKDGSAKVVAQGIASRLIDYLVREIIYWLADEKREEMSGVAMFVESVWVAVDLLGLLCNSYEQPCGIRLQYIQIWRFKILDIWHESADVLWGNDDDLLQEVLSAFDRLREAAQKYPLSWW